MNSLATALATLAEIDEILDELQEELGDLPQQVKEAEQVVRERTLLAEDTERMLKDVEDFKGRSHIRLQEIKDKEDHLASQQFNVRNNREFDAITHEIESLRQERNHIFDEQRTIGVKEENLRAILHQQQSELEESRAYLNDKEAELSEISQGHNDEIRDAMHRRHEVSNSIPEALLTEYERIRTFHRDAAVKVRRNSCSGCFNAVPPQKIVEMRNKDKANQLFMCEHCGRILIQD
jgi:predicted  nucleic acid-binding Zn-ribbon protein